MPGSNCTNTIESPILGGASIYLQLEDKTSDLDDLLSLDKIRLASPVQQAVSRLVSAPSSASDVSAAVMAGAKKTHGTDEYEQQSPN